MIPSKTQSEKIDALFQALDQAPTQDAQDRLIHTVYQQMLCMMQQMVNDYQKLQLSVSHNAQDLERKKRKELEESTDSKKQFYVAVAGGVAMAVVAYTGKEAITSAMSQGSQLANGIVQRSDQAAQILLQAHKDQAKQLHDSSLQTMETCRSQIRALQDMESQLEQKDHEAFSSIVR